MKKPLNHLQRGRWRHVYIWGPQSFERLSFRKPYIGSHIEIKSKKADTFSVFHGREVNHEIVQPVLGKLTVTRGGVILIGSHVVGTRSGSTVRIVYDLSRRNGFTFKIDPTTASDLDAVQHRMGQGHHDRDILDFFHNIIKTNCGMNNVELPS